MDEPNKPIKDALFHCLINLITISIITLILDLYCVDCIGDSRHILGVLAVVLFIVSVIWQVLEIRD
jgi:hypothetical protein